MARKRASFSIQNPHIVPSSDFVSCYPLSQLWYEEADPIKQEHAYALSHYGVIHDLTATERVTMRKQLDTIRWERGWRRATDLFILIAGSYVASEIAVRIL